MGGAKLKITFATTIEKHGGDFVIDHTHACHEVVFYDEGCSGMGQIGEYKYEFSGGCVAMIPKGVSHFEKHFATGRVIFFGFDDDGEYNSVCLENLFCLKRYFRDILSEVCDQSFGYEEMLELTLRKILIHIRRSESGNSHSVTNLTYCREYIEENFTQHISLADLASTSGYSYDYFRHLFTTIYGQSPSSLIMDLRLELAEKMLRTTNISCTEIAHHCGFFDSGQMSKLIKKKLGMTPLEVRKI